MMLRAWIDRDGKRTACTVYQFLPPESPYLPPLAVIVRDGSDKFEWFPIDQLKTGLK